MNVQIDPNALLRAKYERNYKAGRSNLLLVIIFTIVSMITFYWNGSYFLFSAYVPLMVFSVFAAFGWVAGGDPEMIAELDPETIEMIQSVGEFTWVAIGFVIGMLMLAVYFVCWLLSKKHPGALIVAAVLFATDCALLLLSFDMSMIVDVLFHAWAMYYLISAIASHKKLKNIPDFVPVVVDTTATEVNEPMSVEEWSKIDTTTPSDENDDNSKQD